MGQRFKIFFVFTADAFTVSITSNLRNPPNAPIVWDKVITMEGSGFDSKTGIFTCQNAGVHVFTWTTLSRSASDLYCYAYIYHNGARGLLTHSVGDYEMSSKHGSSPIEPTR